MTQGDVWLFCALSLCETRQLHFNQRLTCLSREIIQRVADVMKMYSFIHVAEAYAVRIFAMEVTLSLTLGKISLMSLFQPLQAVTGGIVRGAGKQMIGAVCNLVCFYFIGFPIGVSLMFPAKMGIAGEDQCMQIYTRGQLFIQTKKSPSFLLCCRYVDRVFDLCFDTVCIFYSFPVQTKLEESHRRGEYIHRSPSVSEK